MKKILLQASLIIVAYTCRAQEIDNAVITSSTFTASSFISDNVGWLAPDMLPGFGIYKILDGYSDIYFAGRLGNVGIWKE